MRILIAEDDRISRTFMKEFMKEYGQCDVAVDGMEALDFFMDAVKKEDPYRHILWLSMQTHHMILYVLI